MERRDLPGWLDAGVFTVALVILVLGAAGGPGWTVASDHAVLAPELERAATAPLYSLVASVAAYLPAGEPGFRLAIANSLLGAVLLVGVLRAARALLPKDPLAGVIAVVLLALAPAFRDAAGFAGPSMLAATGVVWAIALAIEHDAEPRARLALGALACAAIAIGSAPWLGALIGVLVISWLWRTGSKDMVVLGVFAVGAMMVVLWLGAIGSLPGASPNASAVIGSSSRGAATIVVGAGLLGVAFAAITNLGSARWLGAALVLAVAHAVVVDHDPTTPLALLAIGCAVIPSAIVRAIGSTRRHVVVLVASAPLVGAALLTGPAFGVDDPGPAPARLASDVIGAVPAGPGVFVATRRTTWSAIEYARSIAGARPDLALAPMLPLTTADGLVVNSLREGRVAASDTFAFGTLDPTRAYPRGRGFELHLDRPMQAAPIRFPARYESAIGEQQAVLLAVERARYETANLRLGNAARAAGLTSRFGAADLAILSTAAPARPELFSFIPLDRAPPGPWLLELLGDDLMWIAGLDPPDVEEPLERKLHSLWRKLLQGQMTPDDPAIAALGPSAVTATAEMLAALKPK
jgi:hypothetical protein